MWRPVIASTDSSASSGIWLPTTRRTPRPSATMNPRVPSGSHLVGARSAIGLRVDGGRPAELVRGQASREVVIEDEAKQERSIERHSTVRARLLEGRAAGVVLEEDPARPGRRGGHGLQAGKADIAAIFADREPLLAEILHRPGHPVVCPPPPPPLFPPPPHCTR